MDGNGKLVVATSLIGASAVLGAAWIQANKPGAPVPAPEIVVAGDVAPLPAASATDRVALDEPPVLAGDLIDGDGRYYQIVQTDTQLAIKQYDGGRGALEADRLRRIGDGALDGVTVSWSWQDNDGDAERCVGKVVAGGAGLQVSCAAEGRDGYPLRLVKR